MAYQIALEDASAFALALGVKAALQGAHGHRFRPSPLEFFRVCSKAVTSYVKEDRRAKRREDQLRERRELAALNAKKTPESKARVQALRDALCNDGANADAETATTLDLDLVTQIPDRPKPEGAGWARLKAPSLTKRDAGGSDEDASRSDEDAV